MNRILCLLLLTTPTYAQVKTTLPVEDMDKPGSLQALQQSLDDKFSVGGGTVANSSYFASSMTIYGPLYPQGGIIFPAGTTLTGVSFTSMSAGGYTFDHQYASTETILNADYTEAGTVGGACLGGSTITLTTTGGNYLEFRLLGLFRNSGAGQVAVGGFRLDGAYFDNQTASLGLFASRSDAYDTVTVVYRTRNRVTAGSHSGCIYLFVTGSNAELFCASYPMRCRFEIKEVPW